MGAMSGLPNKSYVRFDSVTILNENVTNRAPRIGMNTTKEIDKMG